MEDQSMDRPIWNRETTSVDDYQRALTRFLGADLPPFKFSASMDLVNVLERLADAEDALREICKTNTQLPHAARFNANRIARIALERSTPSGGTEHAD
jgi:hypothetical protein